MRERGIILSEEDLLSTGKDSASLQRKVYDSLIGKLLNKELVPGQMINRRQIADEMGVSVAPVLEALLMLEQEGLVRTIPRKGTVVKPALKEDIIGNAVVREAIEVEAATIYCGRKILEHFNELTDFAVRLDACELKSPEHARMETIFHASLVRLAGFEALFQAYIPVNRISFFYRINTMRSDIGTQSQKHADLVEKLCTDDVFKATEAIRSHLRSGKPWSEEIYR